MGLAMYALAFLALTILLFIVGCVLMYVVSVWRIHRKLDHLPGPRRSGFFTGSISEMMKKAQNGVPFSQIWDDWCQEYGPTYVIFSMNIAMVFTIEPEAIKDILVNRDFRKSLIAYRPLVALFGQRFMGHGLVSERDPEIWAPRRSVITPAFSRGLLKPLMAEFNRLSDVLLDKLSKMADGATMVTLLPIMNRTTLDLIGKVAFDMDISSLDDENNPFTRAVKTALGGMQENSRRPFLKLNPFAEREWKQSIRDACRFIRQEGLKKVRERQAATERGEDVPEDILSYLIKAAGSLEGDNLETLIDDFVTFFIAGQETTANTLSFAIQEVYRYPEVLAKLRAEVDEVLGSRSEIEFSDLPNLQYCDSVIKETLRLYPPAGAFFRTVDTDDFKIGSYHIPKGTHVIASTFSAGRHPMFHQDPLKFNPDRFRDEQHRPTSYSTFPFSLGSRNCIGQNFAKIETKVILVKFVQKLDLHFDPDQSFGIAETTTLHPKDGVRGTLTYRQ